MLSVILLDSCRGENLIVIDNTHVKRWEMAPYFEMAETYRYAVLLVEPRTPWRNNPKVGNGAISDSVRVGKCKQKSF